ncbi:hypothetical protein LXT21_13315 [Myxococcus sp. K38C18041901]|uniref:hypothetical protein n=1 Tax=Myxococcus guangdongensis TaxID=2906760 RepID=UPI0020A82022|nr:hypothetical protein [Myxococcus guangdongensis]MCP3059759.1 hypothetical protein [Myxococcus guangdongensis]
MGRIVTFVLGFGVLAAAAWYVMQRPARTDPEAAAARRLENVHKAADRLETDLNKKADAIFDKVE